MSTVNACGNGLSGTTGTGNYVGATSPTLVTPKIGQINDTNANAMFLLNPASSAINSFQFNNAATGTAVDFKAIGGNTDVGMNIWTAGAGEFQMITQAATNPITFYSGTGGQHTTTFQMANTSAGRTVTFPDASGTLLMTGQAINTVPSISFGGSTLSVYQTGSWTPTDASGASLTFSSATGGYTRIGNMVFAYCQVTYPATADASAAKIGSLPYTSANALYAQQGSVSLPPNANATNCIVNINSTTVSIYNNAAIATTNAQLTTAPLYLLLIYPIS
jgi:hypothetical protein